MIAELRQNGNARFVLARAVGGNEEAERRACWSGNVMQCQRPIRGFVPGEDLKDTSLTEAIRSVLMKGAPASLRAELWFLWRPRMISW